MAGYTRLVEEDTEATVAAWTSARNDIIEPAIAGHSGRIVKLTGDGFLAEFPVVQDAVECAIDMQEKLADSPLAFRMGVNLGDIVDDGQDIHGEGVNIAARIESMADDGGIWISGLVYESVHNQLDYDFEDMGQHEVKNVSAPVQIYRILTDAGEIASARSKAKEKSQIRYAILAVAVMLLITFAGLAAWHWPWQQAQDVLQSPMSAESSIAVLPFSNLSSDPDQEYFSDGITNDLITDLSKFHDLFVIASNSVFTYKGRAVDIRQVARELSVRYVLEGSVQKIGENIRINAQLIDGTTGRHLWAERFDERAENIFDLQDGITRRIVRTLAVRLTDIERKQAFAKPTRDLKAYDYVLRARALAAQISEDENFMARKLFRQAIEIDPAYASAYAGLGWTYFEPVLWGWTGSPQKALKQAHNLAQQAISLETSNAEAHRLLTQVYSIRRQHDFAVLEAERVIALNPNDARSYADQGVALVWAGRVDGAILSLEMALRFDPNMNPRQFWSLGLAYYLKARYEDAIAVLEKSIDRRTDISFAHAVLAASYAQIDRPDRARAAAAAVRRLNPFFKVDEFGPQFGNPADAQRMAEGLRKAGLD